MGHLTEVPARRGNRSMQQRAVEARVRECVGDILPDRDVLVTILPSRALVGFVVTLETLNGFLGSWYVETAADVQASMFLALPELAARGRSHP